MIVDSHQHFWRVSRGDYGWLTPEAGLLYRDYLPEHLAALLQSSAVQATVLVQAAPTEAETRYLLELSQTHSFIAGVVGWVDFDAPDVQERMIALQADSQGKLKGLRPMIQDMPDPRWLLREDLDHAFDSLIRAGLVFDALVRPVHLDMLRSRLMRHPNLVAVLDHAGKPDIQHDDFTGWARDLRRLAQDTQAFCKLSGLLTEAGSQRSVAGLVPYVEHIFDCFGPDRVLWGSDWPVLSTAGDYGDWLTLAQELCRRVGIKDSRGVFGGTALSIYRLELPQSAEIPS
jgi:L-fuconolactonase